MKVYRIENNQGFGPYFNEEPEGAKWKKLWMGNPHTSFKHPEPFEDKQIKKFLEVNPELNFSKYVCGFSSEADLYNWFTNEEVEKLNALGYKVRCREVSEDKIITGTFQIMYYRPQSKLKLLWKSLKFMVKVFKIRNS